MNNYLKTYPQPANSYYNGKNRGYPDISALATNFQIIENGANDYIGGTSASTPAVAAIFSLLNEARMSRGFPPLGFLNPLLYSLQSSSPPPPTQQSLFRDILQGSNAYPPCPGFSASPGWDAITGFGSVCFFLLLSLSLSIYLSQGFPFSFFHFHHVYSLFLFSFFFFLLSFPFFLLSFFCLNSQFIQIFFSLWLEIEEPFFLVPHCEFYSTNKFKKLYLRAQMVVWKLFQEKKDTTDEYSSCSGWI